MQSGGGKICFIFGQICFHATFLGGYATWLSKGRRGEACPVRTGFSWSKFRGDLTNTARDVTSILLSMRGHNVRFVRHAKGRSDPFVCHADAKTVPPRRGTNPEGAEWVSRPLAPGCIHGQHKRAGKRGKSLLCTGNPSGPGGRIPYKAEVFCLRTDNQDVMKCL